jgi:prepilin-type N-terminal cleavage/methylation domain-containing protein
MVINMRDISGNNNQSREKGFSVVEIMLVIAIISTLIAVFFLISWERTRGLKDSIKDAENQRNQTSAEAPELKPDEKLVAYSQLLESRRLKTLSEKKPADAVAYRVGKGVTYESNKLQDAPRLAWKLLQHAVLKSRAGSPEEALKLLTEASALDPVNPMIYTELARTYIVMNNPQEALNQANEAIRFEPEYAEPWLVRASLYIENGSMEQAEKDLGIAAEKKQSDGELFLLWSKFWMKKGDSERASEYLQRFQATRTALGQ